METTKEMRSQRPFGSRNSMEETMKITHRFWRYLLIPISLAGMLSISSAAELNPAAVTYKLPDQIPWTPVDARGAQTAVVVGDPNKPGFYMVYTKWKPGLFGSDRKSTRLNSSHFVPSRMPSSA